MKKYNRPSLWRWAACSPWAVKAWTGPRQAPGGGLTVALGGGVLCWFRGCMCCVFVLFVVSEFSLFVFLLLLFYSGHGTRDGGSNVGNRATWFVAWWRDLWARGKI